MTEQPGEVNCVHGIGHKKGLHGCDGCCSSDNQKAKMIDNEFEFRRGYHFGIISEQQRLLLLLEDESPIWEDPRGTQQALKEAILNIEPVVSNLLTDPIT